MKDVLLGVVVGALLGAGFSALIVTRDVQTSGTISRYCVNLDDGQTACYSGAELDALIKAQLR